VGGLLSAGLGWEGLGLDVCSSSLWWERGQVTRFFAGRSAGLVCVEGPEVPQMHAFYLTTGTRVFRAPCLSVCLSVCLCFYPAFVFRV